MFNRIQTYLEWLQRDPVDFLVYMAYTVVTILVSLILHECAHGYVALRCGDPTAKMLGRLSLNPARHLDPIGTLCRFFMGFGWAKPVSVNPRNFSNYRRDDFLVSIAGIVVNLTLFIGCCFLSTVINRIMMGADSVSFMQGYFTTGVESYVSPYYMDGYNIMYGSLDEWSMGFLQYPWMLYIQRFLLLMAHVNLSLAIFNLLPFPPLDGFHIVNAIIFKGRLILDAQKFQIAHILLIIMVVSGFLDDLLFYSGEFVYTAVLKTFLMITGQGV